MRQPVIIAYDIQSDATRRRVYRILLEWRLDGQKSVHECLLEVGEAKELFMQLTEAIDRDTDRLLLVWVAPRRALFARGLGRIDALFRHLLSVR